MKDEIKEIIIRMSSYTIHYDYCSEGNAEEDIDILLDYITNLQEELKEQKRIEEADFKLIQELEEENEILKENNQNMQVELVRSWEKIDKKDRELNILRGVDKNE